MPPPPHVVEDQRAVFDFLADPSTHGLDHPVTRIDTHGAAVFLAGANAYKVKRAVRFPFMDFSTLEKRRAACAAEIAVNRPNAPDIYRGVLPITRQDGRLGLDGAVDAVEWCVHMRRFDERATLDKVAETVGLTPDLIRRTAAAIVRSHRRAPAHVGVEFAAGFAGLVVENGESLGETPALFPDTRVRALTDRSLELLRRVTPVLETRERDGRVRRCHGDLHLRNIVLLDTVPTLFDAIEFDETLAMIDVLYDLAFLLMDLGERGLGIEANLLLNRYLVEDRDPRQIHGLAAIQLFISVRAAIRAKVIAAGLAHASPAGRAALEADARRYFAFAERVLVA
jgi:aminoglycoside phosphotransferase family enzyme